jgi:CMP-N,N'-diacetyllegionaminic acid synthase
MRVLYLLTARGGSKGIPGKNLREIGGHSLVAWKCVGALQARTCTRLIVSTDSEAIRDEALRYGAEAPFLRPAHLATDEADSASVVMHAMQWIEQNAPERYDAVMLLEPTAPFTRPEDYDAASALMEARGATLVVGVTEVPINPIFIGPLDEQSRISVIVHRLEKVASMRRQDREPEYTMNGALYLLDWNAFRTTGRVYSNADSSYGHIMDRVHGLEIDHPLDLEWAEFLVQRGMVYGCTPA